MTMVGVFIAPKTSRWRASGPARARSRQWRTSVKNAAHAADDVFAVDIIRRGLRHGDQILQ